MALAQLKGNTVVSFPGGRRVRLDSPTAIRLVQTEILTCGLTSQELADRAGIALSTVWNIGCGNTKRPAFNTIWSILSALGWSIYAEKD